MAGHVPASELDTRMLCRQARSLVHLPVSWLHFGQPTPAAHLSGLTPALPPVLDVYRSGSGGRREGEGGSGGRGEGEGGNGGRDEGEDMGPPMSLPTVSNMVYRVHLKCNFDMRRIYLAFGHAEYHPAKFAGAKIRHGNVTCSVYRPGKMVITSGKTVMTAKANAHRYRILVEEVPQPVVLVKPPGPAPAGAESLRLQNDVQLHHASRRQLRQELPYFSRFGLRTPQLHTFFDRGKVVNVVGSGHLGTSPISLASIFAQYREFVKWKPAEFLGLIVPINRKFIMAHPELARTLHNPCTIIIFHTGRDNIMGAKSVEDLYTVHRFFAELVRGHRATDFPAKADILEYSIAEHKRVTEAHQQQFRKRQRQRAGTRASRSGSGTGRAVKRARTTPSPAAAAAPAPVLDKHQRQALEMLLQ